MSNEQVTDGTYWDGIPHDRAMAWSRMFFDFPPSFPGASFMNYAYRAFKRGIPGGFEDWAEAARAGERVGMTPEQYYTLKLTLKVIDPQHYEKHPANNLVESPNGRRDMRLKLDEWGLWVKLVNSGSTPLSATRMMLSGGTAAPRGFLVDLDTGTVTSTDDA